MGTVKTRPLSLPAEHADYIDNKVSSGSYASGSEVVRAGLRALQEQDAAVARRTHAIKAGKEKLYPAKVAFAELKARSAPARKSRR